MTDMTPEATPRAAQSLFTRTDNVRRRYRRGSVLKYLGLGAIGLVLFFLCVLLWSILSRGIPAFFQYQAEIQLYYDPEILEADGTGPEALGELSLRSDLERGIFAQSLRRTLEDSGIDTAAFDDGDLSALIYAANRRDVRDELVADPDLVGQTVTVGVPISLNITRYLTGGLSGEGTSGMPPGFNREQLDLIDQMVAAGLVDRNFNWGFFTNEYSQSGEVAGIGPALMGSAYMMLVVLVFSLVFGVAASIYLEEFAPKNKFTDFIEINIANLAAVPSIVFGILGAAILLTLGDLGFGSSIRGTALLGGIVLSLMTLPTIVIATRSALKAVPPSIRDAALGVGASKLQTVFHHTLPLAMPGILTGTIIGIAQALGETAPLLLIGLSVSTGASILSSPFTGGLLEQAQSMPTVVYLFAQNQDLPVREGLAQAAIIVMLALLFALNIIAILLRRRFERRW
ncbi:phosphate ABC transporter permease PstA [Pseudoroseicyclus tamaricis]|uniref:Phosphate transport system permease protein PstA n=1 Tax=Pseudoroseicyclus tamaricis TaxID=2705421 RepID=A0A6B2K1L5_9RHOB|nr:phosphate ABC transporter permease PstA [Pseudoroseicyclus tamaricis]NDV01632.1 phosphate ABC transporter permease PstA [Pseudoroseicyclus tamaricis]